MIENKNEERKKTDSTVQNLKEKKKLKMLKFNID